MAVQPIPLPLPGLPSPRPRRLEDEVRAVLADASALRSAGAASIGDVEPFEPGTVLMTTDLFHRLVRRYLEEG